MQVETCLVSFLLLLQPLITSCTPRNSIRIMSEEKKSEPATGLAQKLARKNILELLPYRCARDDYSDGILLDANENAFGPPAHDIVPDEVTLERYPDPYQIPLKQKLATYRGHDIKPNNIFVGVGSDEAIDMLMRIFCVPGRDKIMQLPPTYGMYKVCAKVNDVDIVNVPLTPDFDMDIPKIRESVTPDVKLLFVCSPGNPTAKAFPLSEIEELASSPECQNLIVVVDEAYIDFSKKGSAVALVNSFPNVVVLQTMSKAFGLAAIRCGFCIGPSDIIRLMNNVKAPYNVNKLTSRLALTAFDNTHVLDKNVEDTLKEREIITRALEDLEFVTKVYPSDANFILFRMDSFAQEVYKQMADSGVVTRYRGSEMHCDGCIRVTIGKPDENKSFLELLKKTYASFKG